MNLNTIRAPLLLWWIGVAVAICALSTALQAEEPNPEWQVVVSRENSVAFCFLRGKDCVLQTNLGGWGPQWSWRGISSNDKATGEDLTATALLEVDKAQGQVITIKQHVWKSAPQEISFNYELSAERDVPLTQLVLHVDFEKQFQDGEMTFKHVDGTESKLPLAIHGMGEKPATGTLIFHSNSIGDITTTIDPPIPISYHDALKLVLASTLFKAGKTSTTLTFHFPNPSNLRVKPSDVEQVLQSKADQAAELGFQADDAHAFEPGNDASQSAIDLRFLNEKEAGQSGFLKLNETRDQFLLGDGTPVRFWAVNANISGFNDAQLEQCARWLARMGVNMVRLSGATLQSKAPGSKPTDVADNSLKNAWRIVTTLKKYGIYTTIHPYWGSGNGADVTNWGIAGYTKKDQLWGLLFFNKELQTAYRAWLKELLTRPNPYTGIPLAKDPALGLFILQNEDSLLFWSSQGIKPQQKAVLAAQFAEWLKKKYGSLDAAAKAWEGTSLKEDNFGEGVVGLYIIWEMTQNQAGGKAKRVADQYQFFVETMRRFNADTVAYLRNELGCQMLICADNWRTANDETMEDAERWSYLATDVIAKNHYFGGPHVGGAAGWAVSNGDQYANRSVMATPWALPVNMRQIVGGPNIITESTWTNPDLYQAEAPFLVAAYGSLTGLNGFYWYAVNAPEWAPPPIQKFPVNQPMIGGQFPAAALLYRKMYVQQGQTVVHEERALADMWDRKLPVITEGKAYDPNRDTADKSDQTGTATRANPLSFLAGRVEVHPDGDPAKTMIADVSKLIDDKNKVVLSSTGELSWNYGLGVCTVNTPKAQGACGFLKQAGAIKLAAVQLDSSNAYAAVLVVPLDDLPLKDSKKILVQVGTTARPTGWKTEPTLARPKDVDVDCVRILDRGKAPWLINNTHLSMRLANTQLHKATLLNGNGCPAHEIALERTDSGVALKLPTDAMYVLLSEN